MRVISGEAGGRRLHAPAGRSVRPTSDRVREAIFDSLTSLGAVAGATVVDLFAGTGALGIEALSRGAETVTFVDDDRRSLDTVRANLAATGLAGPRASVVRADALRWCETAPTVDLAFADPPYAFERWNDLLRSLRAGIAVFESDRSVVPESPGQGWDVLRTKRYGGTVVTLARRRADC